MNFRCLPSWLLAIFAVLLSGCGAMTAQNPSGKYSPVNAVAEGNDSRVLLKGADVVAYFTDGKYLARAIRSSAASTKASLSVLPAPRHKALFDKEPTAYLPQFGGYCANGIAYAIPWGGDADTWKIIDGKLYIFGGQAPRTPSRSTKRRTWRWQRPTGKTRSPAATVSSSAGSADLPRAALPERRRTGQGRGRGQGKRGAPSEIAAPDPDRPRGPGKRSGPSCSPV
jgi:hypothetical protein